MTISGFLRLLRTILGERLDTPELHSKGVEKERKRPYASREIVNIHASGHRARWVRRIAVKKHTSDTSPLSIPTWEIFWNGGFEMRSKFASSPLPRRNPEKFNRSLPSPKRDGKTKPFQEWSLSEFINVAHDIKLLKPDVQRFSHGLKEFRNFIHPYQQMASSFTPDEHTAKVMFSSA